jgi:hypothetical protein
MELEEKETKETKKTKNSKIGNMSACDFPSILKSERRGRAPDLLALGRNADWSPFIWPIILHA